MRLIIIQEIIPHYRLPFLKMVAEVESIDLTVVSSILGSEDGFSIPDTSYVGFKWIQLPLVKKNILNINIIWLCKLFQIVADVRPDIIITSGNKRIIQNHILQLLRFIKGFRLLYLQHAKTYSSNSKIFLYFEKLYFRCYTLLLSDGFVLYTKWEKLKMIQEGFPENKLSYLNNTIDAEQIKKNVKLQSAERVNRILAKYDIARCQSIIFIGRLTNAKNPSEIFQYCELIKEQYKGIQVIFISDKPKEYDNSLSQYIFTGLIYDEEIISAIMTQCRFVFIPFGAGLSIIHAFAYGKPVVVVDSPNHCPEIMYVRNDINGVILKGKDTFDNVMGLKKIMVDDYYYNMLCDNALKTVDEYSIKQMVKNLTMCLSQYET